MTKKYVYSIATTAMWSIILTAIGLHQVLAGSVSDALARGSYCLQQQLACNNTCTNNQCVSACFPCVST